MAAMGQIRPFGRGLGQGSTCRVSAFPRTAPPARKGTDPERDEKFESAFLQRRVRKPSVPQRRSEISAARATSRRAPRRRRRVTMLVLATYREGRQAPYVPRRPRALPHRVRRSERTGGSMIWAGAASVVVW